MDEPDDYLADRQMIASSQTDRETINAANKAVAEAMAAFAVQKWYQTLWANVRFSVYWATYWLRLQLAMFLVTRLGYNDRKVWGALHL